VLMEQSSRDDTLVGLWPPEPGPRDACLLIVLVGRAHQAFPRVRLRQEGRAISASLMRDDDGPGPVTRASVSGAAICHRISGAGH